MNSFKKCKKQFFTCIVFGLLTFSLSHAAYITGVTASSNDAGWGGLGPHLTTDGSGWVDNPDPNPDVHVADSSGSGAFLSNAYTVMDGALFGMGPGPKYLNGATWDPWELYLDYDLGGTYAMDEMVIWNGNQVGLPDRGFRVVDIAVSTDGGATYTNVYTALQLNNTHDLNPGLVSGDYFEATDIIDLSGVTADHVRIVAYPDYLGGTFFDDPSGDPWDSANRMYQMSEVRFVDTTLPILLGCCDISDLSVFASQWLDSGLVGEDCVAPPEWDLNDDCSVNFSDFAVVGERWLWGCRETFEELMAKGHGAVVPAHKLSVEWWATRHQEILDRVQQGNVDIIFLGDSITHGWIWAPNLWEESFGTNAVNMGFSGDGTQNVLWRMENGEIDGISPEVAVVLIGVNNTPSSSPEQIADGIKAICLNLRKKLPETEVLLLGIFPAETLDLSIRETIIQTNIIASEIAHCEMIHYLDIGDQFLLPDGSVDPALMSDLIHPTGAGYQVWAEAMAPLLAELMD